MKNHIRAIPVAAALFTLPLISPTVLRADSDEEATTKSTTTTSTVSSQGTISAFAPDSFEIRTSASAAPVRYSYSKTTTYVDENGSPVSMETVRSGVPVTVFYAQSGDQMMASKVVVRQSEPATTTQSTTTTTKVKKDDDDE